VANAWEEGGGRREEGGGRREEGGGRHEEAKREGRENMIRWQKEAAKILI
jgi:hypothetical protein